MKRSEWVAQSIAVAFEDSNEDRELTQQELDDLEIEVYPRTGESGGDFYIGIGAWFLARMRQIYNQ